MKSRTKRALAMAGGLGLPLVFLLMAACGTASVEEEFRGHIEAEAGYEGYQVKKEVVWEENGQQYGLQEGDVIGIHGDEDDYMDFFGWFRVKKPR